MQHPGSTKTHPTTTKNTPRACRRPSPQVARRGSTPRIPTSAPNPVARVPMAALTGGRATAVERAEVDAMSRGERIAAMDQRRLSLPQLSYWSARYGDEVPLIGGEFAYIAMFDPDYCEPARPVRPVRS
jgi:hypothetical protein